MEKVNKFNETEKRKGLSNSNDMTKNDEILVDESSIQKKKKKHKKRNRSRKRIGKADICSVHGCSRYSIHQISIEECAQIKQIFSTFDFSQVRNFFIWINYNYCVLYSYFDFADHFY